MRWQTLSEAALARQVDGHRRALPEGAVVDEAVSGALGERAERSAGPDHPRELPVRCVHRTRDYPVAGPLRLLPEIDEDELRVASDTHDVARGEGAFRVRLVALAATDAQVRGDRDVHQLRIGEVEGVHDRGVLVRRRDLEPGVEAPLLADRADGVPLVVVTGIHQGLVGQGKELAEERTVLRHRVAALEIGAAGPPDEQGVAGEHPVVHREAVRIAGVARGVEGAQPDPLDPDRVAVSHAHRDDVDGRLRPHHGDALRAVAKRPHAAHVVGVDMGIEDLGEGEIELAEKGQVALDLLQHRVDDEGLAAGAPGKQVRVAARADVVELAKEHCPARPSGPLSFRGL